VSDWTVGQKAIVVRHRNGGPDFTEVEIMKIGRKWITVRRAYCSWAVDERFSMDGRSEHNAGYGPRLWATMADFEAERSRTLAWNRFGQIIRNLHRAPSHLTMEDIEGLTSKITEQPQ